MNDCTLCGQNSTGKGFLIINGRLFQDPLCNECRDSVADELSSRLKEGEEVDEGTRVQVIREFLTHPERGSYDSTPSEEVVDYAMRTAGVPREERLAILDCFNFTEKVN